ncbi:Alcohol dehydrogenase GroES-like domain-containing protein [Cladophialophora immunda]|nr:Alcohol dehydrogenase GroES-like domain-containing protein [Cladophialophora immunda]
MTSTTKLPPVTLSAAVHPTDPITTTISTIPLPTSLLPNEVLIKVYAVASNPKDWLHIAATGVSLNSGDDLAGVIVATGSNVSRFRPGDRVAAFHPMGKPYGAYAQYAIAPEHTAFHVPETMSFEEASTIPLVSLTAALTLFRRQGFAAPWDPNAEIKNQRPFLVYAASTSLGTYAIKLAKLAGVTPIVAIGGASSDYLKGLLDLPRDVFLDYRAGVQTIKEQVRQVAEEQKLTLENGLDAFNNDESWVHVSQMLHRGTLSVFSGAKRYDEEAISKDVKILYTFVGTGHEGSYRHGMPKQPSAEDARGDVDFARKFFVWLEDVLRQGKYSGHPYEIIPGALTACPRA